LESVPPKVHLSLLQQGNSPKKVLQHLLATRVKLTAAAAHFLDGRLGPLQLLLGLARPCADLSRGATEDDILGVAAIVALQAVETRKLVQY
jgi:hypothetical protein